MSHHLLLISTLVSIAFSSSPNSTVKHKVKVWHPIYDTENANEPETILIEEKNEEGLSKEFHMNVRSVFCIENICKVVPVCIYWDILGNYKEYQLDEGLTLEKDKGEHFSKSDYLKLDNILRNKNSEFRNLSYGDITSYDVQHGVDAVSGATALELRKETTIEGATWTCYTMWHWANGDISKKIRRIAGNSFNLELLVDSVLLSKTCFQRLAIEELIIRKEYNITTFEALLERDYSSNITLQNLRTNYLNQASDSLFFLGVMSLFSKASEREILQLLNSVDHHSNNHLEEFYIFLFKELNNINSFPIVEKIYHQIEDQQINSDEINSYAILHLKKDILISRRAYWFLKEQKLNKEQEKELKEFYLRNQEYL